MPPHPCLPPNRSHVSSATPTSPRTCNTRTHDKLFPSSPNLPHPTHASIFPQSTPHRPQPPLTQTAAVTGHFIPTPTTVLPHSLHPHSTAPYIAQCAVCALCAMYTTCAVRALHSVHQVRLALRALRAIRALCVVRLVRLGGLSQEDPRGGATGGSLGVISGPPPTNSSDAFSQLSRTKK